VPDPADADEPRDAEPQPHDDQADPPLAPEVALRRLLDTPGSTAISVNDGDELLLLMPEADEATVTQATAALAELFPTVTFLVMCGITGAVVMPRRYTPDDAPVPDDMADKAETYRAGWYAGNTAGRLTAGTPLDV
jgi:hypothetical protein